LEGEQKNGALDHKRSPWLGKDPKVIIGFLGHGDVYILRILEFKEYKRRDWRRRRKRDWR